MEMSDTKMQVPGMSAFLTKDLTLGNTDQQQMSQFICYLTRSQIMGIRLVSNFRSLITLLLSNQTTPSSEVVSQMREVADEIGQDSN